MAHFAKLDENNIVVNVIVVSNNALDFNNEETSGVEFLNNLYNTQDNWKQTSYNSNIRFNYAGIGFIYDETRDAFIAPEPNNHLGFDEKTCKWITQKPPYET